MTAVRTVEVINSYTHRARFARAEAATVPRPRMLRHILYTVTHVAELPCSTGHFLTAYAEAGMAVTLVDGNPTMLAHAADRAAEARLNAARVNCREAVVQELGRLDGVDGIVMPNAALNQMARQCSLAEILRHLRCAVAPGTQLPAQILCTHPGGGIDNAGFYDPNRQHDVWFADRYLDPSASDGAVLRRRRQHRNRDGIRIDFAYLDPAGTTLHDTSVHLLPVSVAEATAAFESTGFGKVHVLPGERGLSEILATALPHEEGRP